MPDMIPAPLVSSEWLYRHIHEVALIDGSFTLEAGAGRLAYLQAHVPGAVYFDIDEICDQASPLPHMVPSADQFAAAVGVMGIARETPVVVYDTAMGAPRVWWMFRLFGHHQVAVLDGGLRDWMGAGYPIATGVEAPPPVIYQGAALEPTRLAHLRDVQSSASPILDSRSQGRFEGLEAEFRPGLADGHIPGSANLPYERLLQLRTGRMKDAHTLRALFDEVGVDIDQPWISTCGSGVTACYLALAAQVAGGQGTPAVYDGSWTEYGASGLPVATGKGKSGG
ncbi:MAG: sulfurtransferase [Pseudomonadota bacterium]